MRVVLVGERRTVDVPADQARRLITAGTAVPAPTPYERAEPRQLEVR